MHPRDYGDIMGGAALILIGTFATIYALTVLFLGTVRNMGPGMFPAALGCILAGLGVAILVPALFRKGKMPSFTIRPLLTVIASILSFAIMLPPFGLIPAIIVQTLVATQADRKLSMKIALILAAGLSLSATLIFQVGLSLQVAIISWPW